MGSKKGKQLLFAVDQLVMLVAWVAAVFAIFHFKSFEVAAIAIVALIVLNLGLAVWLRRFLFPIEKKAYKRFLATQTIFLVIWAAVLAALFYLGAFGFVLPWAAILVAFYIAIGFGSRKMLFPKN